MSKWIIVFCLSYFCFMTVGANAKQQLSEAETLKRALVEFNAIQTLVDESINRSDRQARFGFNYTVLRQDLHLVKHGIHSAVYGSKFHPERFRELSGDYGDTGVVGEAEILQMLIVEIQALVPLFEDARSQASDMLRLKLNYNVLFGDLYTVVNGIQQALAGSAGHPRKIPVLRGGFSHG